MAIIQVLDVQTANRIAAGEVVERPASVIKELVENALDAGATAVTVDIEEGGIQRMRVVDNGSGIPEQQLRLAIERHATSKIRSGDSLTTIPTLGFRGEALPSVAAVSKLTIMSRTKSGEGAQLTCQGGREIDIRPSGCPLGTSVKVEELFFNTPARLKFLKRPSTEAAAIAEVMEAFILGRPDIAFRFQNGGKMIYATSGDGKLRSAAGSVLGAQAASEWIDVEGSRGGVAISGLLGVGDMARSNRTRQLFFINGRAIRSPVLSSALEMACMERVLTGRFPVCALAVTLPYERVDVNVHPNKTEVRFDDEMSIRLTVNELIQQALHEFDTRQRQSFQHVERPREPVVPTPSVAPTVPMKPAAPAVTAAKPQERVEPIQIWDIPKPAMPLTTADGSMKLKESETIFVPKPFVKEATQQSTSNPEEPSPEAFLPEPELPQQALPIHLLGTFLNTYILAAHGDQLLLIDQHAAHERMMYEKLKRALDDGAVSQPLLVPLVLTLSMRERDILIQNEDVLHMLGFEWEAFGDCDVSIRAVPHILGQPAVKNFFLELIDRSEYWRPSRPLDARKEAIIQLACKKAVKAGDVLSEAEIFALLHEYERGELLTCPHGRPVCVRISKSELERRFKRTQ